MVIKKDDVERKKELAVVIPIRMEPAKLMMKNEPKGVKNENELEKNQIKNDILQNLDKSIRKYLVNSNRKLLLIHRIHHQVMNKKQILIQALEL